MSVHYKFKSALEYDTVTFDGLHISVKDLKNAIVQQKRIGKNTDFDLQVTNAQTKEVYDDDNALIAKNTSLLIARIPTSVSSKQKNWEGYGGDSTPPAKLDEGGPIAKATDLSSLDAPEDDKISAMMSQSTQDYDPSNYMKIRGANQMGAVPPNYRCYKCHQTGHWIKDCPLGQGSEPIEIKKSTGIPRSFMVPVEGPQVPGAMMTPNGSYAVPVLDHQAYTQKGPVTAPIIEVKADIPEDLLCSICSDLLTDAVMIPCCGNSFCDECIRSCLLESDEHECPDCHEKEILPITLIPNRFLRNSVTNFKSTTGYVKKPVFRQYTNYHEQKKSAEKAVEPTKESSPGPGQGENGEKAKSEAEERTIISEADSTESKSDILKDADAMVKKSEEKAPELNAVADEGPPGVSPKRSPKSPKHTSTNSHSSSRERSSKPSKSRSTRDQSPPKKSHRSHSRRSPNFHRESTRDQEDRPGTPTVDEPGVNYRPQPARTPYNTGPPGTMPHMLGIPTMQGPPPQTNIPPIYNQNPQAMGNNYPPTHGPPPNFRLPPPGTAPPAYNMPPGNYSMPPSRPVFDSGRPPITGPPPGYPGHFAGNSRSHHGRDYNRRGIRDRTPPGIIDDPLAAFNRMIREKDERDRRIKQSRNRRSYSRSRSRSRSFSRSPRRLRSRSPRRRQSRSRSRSFSLSRSRSRSYSGGSLRGSPYRQLSPISRRSPPPMLPRRGPSRYRSPIRSPPRHHRGAERGGGGRDHRDFDHARDYGRDDGRGYNREKENHRGRDDRDKYFDRFDDRRGPQQMPAWNQHQQRMQQDVSIGYYPDMQQQQQQQQQSYQNNRYPPHRDYPQPYMNKNEHLQPIMPQQGLGLGLPPTRRFDDIAPPGVEEPPIPGLENISPRFDHFLENPMMAMFEEPPISDRDKEKDTGEQRKRRHDKERRSKSPDRVHRNPSPKPKSRDHDSPDKHKRKKKDHSDHEDHETKKKDHSEDEKTKKSKDKKKRKEKKDSDRKKKKDRKERHKKDDKDKDKEKEKDRKAKEEAKPASIEPISLQEDEKVEEKVEVKAKVPTPKLYDDIPSDDVDNKIVETYVKPTEEPPSQTTTSNIIESEVKEPYNRLDDDEEENNILELHSTDIDLKVELDKHEVLLPMPEKSKWEVEEEASAHSSPKDFMRLDFKSDKSGKVTNEVLKRAENAIFAKAINAIRPIEIKKISTDRAKLYSGEREIELVESETKKPEVPEQAINVVPAVRVPIKERLGIKVEDDRSLSPFSKRGDAGRNYERRVEVDERKHRRSRSKKCDEPSRDKSKSHHRSETKHTSSTSTRDDQHRSRDHKSSRNTKSSSTTTTTTSHSKDKDKDKEMKERSSNKDKSSKSRSVDERSRGSKRSRSRSDNDKHKRRDKKQKKESKPKKTSTKTEEEKVKVDVKVPSEKSNKPILDESHFEPDYDLESEPEKEVEKKVEVAAVKKVETKEKERSSSSDSSSSSSSDEDRKKKKHKKHRKKKRRGSSSSSSDSDSDSTDEDREKKRKKHKKKQKKKKRSKHK